MRIGFDVSAAQRMHGGITEYVYRLLEAFSHIPPHEEFALFSTHDLRPGTMLALPPLPTNFQLYPLRFSGRMLKQSWRYLGWPQATSVLPATDVFFAPHFFVPPGKFRRLVVTVHDLLFEEHPEWFGEAEANRFRWAVRNAVSRADAFIAVSEYTKQQMINRFTISPERITVIPHGVSYQEPTQDDWQRVQRQYNLPNQYILILGTLEDRKNIDRVLSAYESLLATRSMPPLVFAGQLGRLDQAVVKRLQLAPLSNHVRLLGRFEHQDRSAILSHARMLVFPSLAEGFGLPVLEGFAAGIPVLTSTVTSLPEVAGDAALLVDPTDVPAIATGIEKLLEDNQLRERNIHLGRQRAAQFTWDICARHTLDVLTQVAASK